jgi:hypothetical protein
MQEQLIKILENRLSLELSKYDNLPFYLAYLYITLKESNIIYFSGHYIKYDKIDVASMRMNPYMTSDSFLSSIDNKTFRLDNMTFSNGNLNPFTHPLYVINRAGEKDKNLKNKLRQDNNNYVYYRHSNLKTLINKLCELYKLQHSGTVPFKYIIPYLFFNRDKEARMLYKGGVSILKYDLQNETIREKDQYHKNSKYYKGVRSYEVMNWYNNITHDSLYCMCYT